MSVLNAAARAVIASGKLAHLVTLNRDGSPQLSVVWIGLDGDEIVSGHLDDRQKLRNVRRDPRVALSLETGVVNAMGLGEYLVVRGTGRVTEGGAPSCCNGSLMFLGPNVRSRQHRPSARPDLAHSTQRIGGVSPWADVSRSEPAGVGRAPGAGACSSPVMWRALGWIRGSGPARSSAAIAVRRFVPSRLASAL
jgi:PPOX class probable F420-dependent enzyme